MKKVTKCGSCETIIRVSGSFTAEITEPVIIGEYDTGQERTTIIKLCRPCASRAGYKVKGYSDGERE
jgi:hypothetical protein